MEPGIGIWTGSLAVTSDAFHTFLDRWRGTYRSGSDGIEREEIWFLPAPLAISGLRAWGGFNGLFLIRYGPLRAVDGRTGRPLIVS